MKLGVAGILAAALAIFVLAGEGSLAHHSVAAKFDESKPTSLTGIVTYVDWRNPHVHVFVNVRGTGPGDWVNWAVELPSPIELHNSGWTRESVQPGDEITVQGFTARNGSRQVWSNSMVMAKTGRQVYNLMPSMPEPPLAKRPVPLGPDGKPRLGAMPGGAEGYWAYPSSTVLVERGVNVDIRPDGLLRNIADAAKVAPMQPWALQVYRNRQSRFLQDDPTFLNCKPTGGPRQFQDPFGVQFVEDHERQRIFVLLGGGNRNYRIIYLDGRSHVGQVGGDDDNPLYYGRSVAQWEGQTLVADTRGFNEDFWFTNGGLPHTDQLRLVERFTRTDFDTLQYDVTIEDPGAYTRPWSTGWTLKWVGGQELPAHFCQDNRP